ncbi:MAG TPA: VOC family protein [Acidimicrobiales bacterium]
MPINPSRVFHVNVNCSDLDRSLAFYRDTLGLAAMTRTTPAVPQPGAAFGLDEVQWDAWILQGDRGSSTPVLDLLEWKTPEPEGSPVTSPTTTGFNRLAFTTPDLDGLHERLVAAGADVWSAPTHVPFEGGGGVRMFVCSDPDGTMLELVDGDDTRLAHVVVVCVDVDRSVRYYRDLLGMAHGASIRSAPHPGAVLRLDGDIATRVERMVDPATGFAVQLVEWLRPTATPGRSRKANELGIFRMAWHTDDIDRDHATLRDAKVPCYAPPAMLDMGPGLPHVRALFWEDPDGACLELIESP